MSLIKFGDTNIKIPLKYLMIQHFQRIHRMVNENLLHIVLP